MKGVKFRNHREVGDILELAERYSIAGADELVFYDISASPDGRTVDRNWVGNVAKLIDIPFCVAGGIRSVDDAERILQQGADKISINSPALQNPGLIEDLADRFGSQCVVIGVDSLKVGDEWFVYQFTGDESRMRESGRKTVEWIIEVQNRGAGEIVLNCMNQDGVRKGYDIEQLANVRSKCDVPLVASGGAGQKEDFVEVFREASVSAALAASVFHDDLIQIPDLKQHLVNQGVEIRL